MIETFWDEVSRLWPGGNCASDRNCPEKVQRESFVDSVLLTRPIRCLLVTSDNLNSPASIKRPGLLWRRFASFTFLLILLSRFARL